MKIEFYKHNVGLREKMSVWKCLNSTFLTTGDYVYRFEKDLAKYLDVGYAIGVTSCTAALHLSLLGLDIGPGDEVITTPMTFAATALAIIHTGAKPIFVDVERSTGNLDLNLIGKGVTKRTKAILPVHLYGQMCDMHRLNDLATKYKLSIIEDSAHALESKQLIDTAFISPGMFSNTACFSFYTTKSITSGEGGAVVTNSKSLAENLRLLRTHGLSKDASNRYNKFEHWDIVDFGWKYNMSNIQASLLIPQLKRVEYYWKKRERLFGMYLYELYGTKGICLFDRQVNSKHGCHLFTVLVPPDKRDLIIQRLHDKGINTTVNYRPLHLLKKFREVYGYNRGDYPNAEYIGDSTISLPLYPKLKDKELLYVSNTLKQIMRDL